MKLKKLVVYFLLFIVQILGIKFLAHHPNLVERYYSNGLYPYISKGFRYALGWIPFSFGDVMYGLLIIALGYALIKLVRKRFKNWKKFLQDTLLITNIVYFSFHLLWGLNYYRLPLHQALEIENDYTTEELISLSQRLIKEANAWHEKLQPNDTAAVDFKFTIDEVFDKTLEGYNKIEDNFPKLDYPPKSIKNSLFRYPLSIMGFSGYLNPITNESQINGLVPSHRWPLISCHEEAHQLGFAKENEANFIAVMATTNNENPYFKYSGYIFALRYCLSEVYRRNIDAGDLLRAKIRPGILANYNRSYLFWASYENPLEPILELFYGNFLKANNQPEGMRSYSYVVALLVNYFKSKPILP